MNASSILSLVSPTTVCGQPHCSDERIAQRIMLYPNELYRVPATYHKLRVASGRAYVTQAGKDMIVSRGQEVILDSTKDVALVSVLKGEQLIMELVAAQDVLIL